ncbi:MAG: NADH-quinone oxidoreductase subunit NuoK [Cytophagales bacterium]
MKDQILLLVSLALFCVGIIMIITKKNAIAILLGIEFIFNAAHINFATFSQYDPSNRGQIFVLFSIIIAACETAVGLALVLRIYKTFKTNQLNELE